jgi:rhombotail lipoprotein
MKVLNLSAITLLLVLVGGCASWFPHWSAKQTGSVVEYLYPDSKDAPQLSPGVTTLRPPVRVGVAFVPGSGNVNLPEAERLKLLERTRAAFARHEFIGAIEVIPSQYLRPKGGFANLEQVARMFNVEVIALLSYDQVQFNDSNTLSVLYWTVVGAYVVRGDQYDIQTMVDASVFDVASRKLLFRAPGTSRINGNATLVGFGEKARAAQMEGFNSAVDDLLPRLQTELDQFKERIKSDANVVVESRPGYRGGGDLGWLSLGMAVVLAGLAWSKRRW